MKEKLLPSPTNSKQREIAINLGKLTFIFFLLKGFFWLGISGWFIYIGSGTG